MKKNEILSEEIAGEHMSGNGFDLIRIQTNENEEQVVSGRELHEFLEVKTKYVDWIDRKIKKYRFAENRDFVAISQKREVANGGYKMVDELHNENLNGERNFYDREQRKRAKGKAVFHKILSAFLFPFKIK